MNIRINGIEVHYELSGPESAPVVTLCHSHLANKAMWESQINALSDYRVLRYDIRGHGQSEAGEGSYEIDSLADDAASILEALGISTTHFIGSSLGGMIAQQLALKHPATVASLVLCSTRGQASPAQQASRGALIDQATQGGMGAIVEPVLEHWFSKKFRTSHPDMVDAAREMIESTSPHGLTGGFHAIEHHDCRERLNEIKVPVLVIVGEDDPITSLPEAFELHVGIDGSDMVVIPKARHLASMERAEEFNDVVTTFLDKHR